MKLREACALSWDMGCRSIEEAVHNIEAFAPYLFGWDNLGDELKELKDDYFRLPPWMVNITDLMER